MKDWKKQIADTTNPSGAFLTIKDIKKELNITNNDISKMFGLTPSAYANSSAKRRYEEALVEFYKIIIGVIHPI